MKKIIAIALLVMLTMSAGYSKKLVSAVSPEKGRVEVEKVYYGMVMTDTTVNVMSKYPGRVLKMNFEEGDSVKKGQVLYKVDRELTGMKYNLIEETSPISGVIFKKNVSAGQFIGPSTPAYIIIDDSRLTVDISIFPDHLNKVRDSKHIYMERSGKEVKGAFKKAITFSDPRTGMITVKLDFNTALIPYERIKVTIVEAAETGLILPKDAVLKDEDGTRYVFVVKDAKAVKTPIETGLENDRETIVTSGLTTDDQVVYVGAYLVSNGEEIIVEE